MTPAPGTLDRARDSFARRAWGAAFAEFSAADREAPLGPHDLEHLAVSAHLIGRDADSGDLLNRAYQGYLKQDDRSRAVRCAFWLGFTLVFRGETAQGGGWLARAQRLLDEGKDDCVERGYLLLPAGFRMVQQDDAQRAFEIFAEAIAIGTRFRDADLTAFAMNGQGRAMIRQGDAARGVALLDEAMVAVTAGEVSPIIAGSVYCSVIEGCAEIYDLRRAQEWTAALDHWCAEQPELVPYRGHCLVRRAEILQLHGAWPEALAEAGQARAQLSEGAPQAGVGSAAYRMAELYRLRGEFSDAEIFYRQAGEWGRSPEPGVALLRLAQGQIEVARAAIDRAVNETRSPGNRASILSAKVEISLAAGDIAAARAASDELATIAGRLAAPYLIGLSAHASGAVRIAEGDPAGALAMLRKAWGTWRELDAPYEAARTRLLVSVASREVGDHGTAAAELDAACQGFRELGATTDLARADDLMPVKASGRHGLTARETEVLQLVASGKTNRAIAGALGISEKTVARHVSNIFQKLGLASRAAATAYAYQHDLT